MLGFILSKLNLLILVAAIFGIVTYFMFGLSDVMVVEQSKNVLGRLVKKTDSLISSPSYCDSTYFYLPRTIRVTGSELFYIMKIGLAEAEIEDEFGDSQTYKYAVFSVASRSRPDEVVAADSFRTKATIRLFDISGPAIEEKTGDEALIILDPQAKIPTDALLLIKEIVSGEEYLYLIPCNSDPLQCEARKDQVAQKFLGERSEFNC